MGARLRVFLTGEQDRSLLKLRTADVPQKVKDRAQVIRLNAHGGYVEKIAAHFNWTAQTVREVLYQFRLHRNDKKTAESAESADERRGRGNLYHSDINGNDIKSPISNNWLIYTPKPNNPNNQLR